VNPIRERAVEERPPSGLRIDASTYNAILAHLRAGLPNEGCGLLATKFEPEGGSERVERFYPGTNALQSPTAFEMDPKEVVAALKEVDACGWRLGAIVHSHPTTVPAPSATDLARAYYPGALMLIVSFKASMPEARAWRIEARGERAQVEGEAPFIID
jgi:[CysO sulfur-carrier protein]-S-L-cysteine hydrolase